MPLRAFCIAALIVLAQLPPAVSDTRTTVLREDQTVSTAGHGLDLLLPDGASLLLGPATEIKLAMGGRQIILVRGGLRLSLGQTGMSRSVRVGGAVVTLNAGSVLVVAEVNAPRVHLFGSGEATVAGGGRERGLYRGGFGVTIRGGRPDRPRRLTAVDRTRDLKRVSPGLAASPFAAPAVSVR